jgi:hypothetical protein
VLSWTHRRVDVIGDGSCLFEFSQVLDLKRDSNENGIWLFNLLGVKKYPYHSLQALMNHMRPQLSGPSMKFRLDPWRG